MRTKAKRSTFAPDELREGFVKAGLREETDWIDGCAFTHYGSPRLAIQAYRERFNSDPKRFHISRAIYLLAGEREEE